MTYNEAINAMIFGHKVKLSDWMGYWFMTPLEKVTSEVEPYIKVFTRDGDILDTPNIDRYRDRDDWEIYDHKGWPFEMALRFLKNGKKVKRISWNSYIKYIRIINKSYYSNHDFYYPLDVMDQFATDWEIVNE